MQAAIATAKLARASIMQANKAPRWGSKAPSTSTVYLQLADGERRIRSDRKSVAGRDEAAHNLSKPSRTDKLGAGLPLDERQRRPQSGPVSELRAFLHVQTHALASVVINNPTLILL